jgi:hypothetical protein
VSYGVKEIGATANETITKAAGDLTALHTEKEPFGCLRVTDAMENSIKRKSPKGKTPVMVYKAVQAYRNKMIEARRQATNRLLPLLDKYFPRVSTTGPHQEGTTSPCISQPSSHFRNVFTDAADKEMIADAITARDVVIELMTTCDRDYRKAVEALRDLRMMNGFYKEFEAAMRKKREALIRETSKTYGSSSITKAIRKSFVNAERSHRNGVSPCAVQPKLNKLLVADQAVGVRDRHRENRTRTWGESHDQRTPTKASILYLDTRDTRNYRVGDTYEGKGDGQPGKVISVLPDNPNLRSSEGPIPGRLMITVFGQKTE